MLFSAFREMLRHRESKILALAAIAVISIGSVVYMLIERWSPVDAVYFCVVTLATVGYGDLHPTTDGGKLFTIFYIVSGLGIIAAFITELARLRPRLGNEIRQSGSGLTSAASASLVSGDPSGSDRPLPTVDPVAGSDPSSPGTDVGPGG